MPFMQAQARRIAMLHVETTAGTSIVPSHYFPCVPTADDVRDYVEGVPYLDDDTGGLDYECRAGWYARFSAHGYMDCTDWDGPYETEHAALSALAESHGVCMSCWEACWEYRGVVGRCDAPEVPA